MDKRIEKVAVLGAGFMGIQISSLSALRGYTVKVYDSDSNAPESALADLRKLYQLQGLGDEELRLERAQKKVIYCSTMYDAVAEAELIIEAIPEKLELKRQIFAEVDKISMPDAIMGSNSSSIPVLKFETAVAHPHRLLNIHFDAPLMQRPLVDIMPGSKTSDEIIEKVKSWVQRMECVPIIVKKPIMGYLSNRLWRVVKRESLMLWANGYGDFQDIDRSWMLQMGVKLGPFALMDAVGLDVVYDIEMAYYNETEDPKDRPPEKLMEMIREGNLGMKTGKGFYDWNAPAFLDPEFLCKSSGKEEKKL